MRLEDDVDAPCGADLDGDVDMERDSDVEEEQDEEEEDEEEMEEEDEDEGEEQDVDENYGKEPRTIGWGEMVNTSADDVDTMVDDQPIVLPEQVEEMREHTTRPQPPVPARLPQPPEPAPRPQTPEPRRRPRTLETHPVGGLEFLGLVTPQKPRLAVPTQREAEAARNTSEVDVDQQLHGESAGGDTLPNVLLPNVPLPNVPLPNVPLPQARPDGLLGEK